MPGLQRRTAITKKEGRSTAPPLLHARLLPGAAVFAALDPGLSELRLGAFGASFARVGAVLAAEATSACFATLSCPPFALPCPHGCRIVQS